MITACPQCRAIVQTRGSAPPGGMLHCQACGSTFAVSASRELRLKRDSSENNLPELDEFDEYVEPPGVAPPVALGAVSPFAFYARVYHRIVSQLGADTTFAILLLALHALIMLAYGSGESSRITSALPADANGALPDMMVRVWRPLALFEVMTVGMVAVVHWIGFLISVKSLGMELSSGSFSANWGLATLPATIAFGAAWFMGVPLQGVAIPAVFIALPFVLLFTCAIYSVRIRMGLVITLVCVALAGPATVFSTRVYGKYVDYSVAGDQQRSAEATSSAQVPPITLNDSGIPTLIPANPKVRELAEIVAATGGVGVPASQPLFAQAGRPAAPVPPPPSALAGGGPTPPQAPPQGQSPATPAVPSDLVPGMVLAPWTDPSGLQQVIWPAIAGECFGTLANDALGNHIVELWFMRDLTRAGAVRIGGVPNASYAVSPSGTHLVRVINASVPIAEVWNIRAARRQTQITLSGGNGTPSALGFLNNGAFAILWRGQNRLAISVYDGQSGILTRNIGWPDLEKRAAGQGGTPPAPAQPEAVWLSADGKLLAGVDATPQICVLETETGRPAEAWRLNLPPGQLPAVSGIAFSAGNKRLALLVDENPNNGQSVLFTAESGSQEVTAVPFSSAAWRLAGCSGPSGRRGRVVDWISDTQLLLYGELVLDVPSGALVQSVHLREAGKQPRGGAFSQYPLPDGTFLLEAAGDPQQGQKGPMQVLKLRPR